MVVVVGHPGVQLDVVRNDSKRDDAVNELQTISNGWSYSLVRLVSAHMLRCDPDGLLK
jgi:hypothetical protein